MNIFRVLVLKKRAVEVVNVVNLPKDLKQGMGLEPASKPGFEVVIHIALVYLGLYLVSKNIPDT